MFLHKAIDLADWKAASFAVLQGHGNQTARKKSPGNKTLIDCRSKEMTDVIFQINR